MKVWHEEHTACFMLDCCLTAVITIFLHLQINKMDWGFLRYDAV
jgi:hypothetical protein